MLEAKHPILAAIEHRKTECGKADHTGLSVRSHSEPLCHPDNIWSSCDISILQLKLERSQDVTRIEPAEGTEKSPVYKRSKSLLSRRSDCSGTKPQVRDVRLSEVVPVQDQNERSTVSEPELVLFRAVGTNLVEVTCGNQVVVYTLQVLPSDAMLLLVVNTLFEACKV